MWNRDIDIALGMYKSDDDNDDDDNKNDKNDDDDKKAAALWKSYNPPKQIDYFAVRDSFFKVYADALRAIFIKNFFKNVIKLMQNVIELMQN